MSIGALGGIVGSVAGAPLAQTKGAETERAQRDSAAAERAVDSSARSERAAGIGQATEDSASTDRDADGRRAWELPQQQADEGEEGQTKRPTKDPTGQAGQKLDLTG